REVLRDIGLRQRIAEECIRGFDAALAAGLLRVGPAEIAVAEGEGFRGERLGERRRGGLEQLPAQIALPGVKRCLDEQLVETRQQLGFGVVQRAGWQSRSLEIAPPVKMRRQRLEFAER